MYSVCTVHPYTVCNCTNHLLIIGLSKFVAYSAYNSLHMYALLSLLSFVHLISVVAMVTLHPTQVRCQRQLASGKVVGIWQLPWQCCINSSKLMWTDSIDVQTVCNCAITICSCSISVHINVHICSLAAYGCSISVCRCSISVHINIHICSIAAYGCSISVCRCSISVYSWLIATCTCSISLYSTVYASEVTFGLDWIGLELLFYLGRPLAMRLLFQAPRTHTHTHIHITHNTVNQFCESVNQIVNQLVGSVDGRGVPVFSTASGSEPLPAHFFDPES